MTNQICFQQHCCRLYKKMLQQLAGYESTAIDEKKRIEWGFGIAIRTWFRIQQEIDNYQFAGEQEEIVFYKALKPKFIGLIDYFTLLYRSVLFRPIDQQEEMAYWKSELEACKSFLLKYNTFRRYYENGNTGMDHIYFVHKYNQQTLLFGINEANKPIVTSYSHLLARIISIKKFQHYLQERIRMVELAN